MKLFRKIYLEVVLGMLLLSVSLLSWTLYHTAKQDLEDARTYGAESLGERVQEFSQKISQEKASELSGQVKTSVVSAIFRQIFGSTGALYEGSTEICNTTSYEFVPSLIKRESKTDNVYDVYYRFSAYTDPQQLDGSWLLLYLSEGEDLGLDGYTIVCYRDITAIYTHIRQLILQSLGVTAILLTLVGILMYRGIYRAVRPMMELKKAAAAIAGGAYESRAKVSGKDEIAELTVSFNRMAEQVQGHVQELSRINESQRQLLGSLAHELKTPLTAIIGYADTLLTVRLSEEKRVKALGYIRDEGKRLSGLSEKMLLLTGLYDNGEDALEKRPVRIADFLEKLQDLTGYRLSERGQQLLISCEKQDLCQEMDEELIMSLLMNLVDNACKASGEGAEILVRADESGISVIDSGRGIPAAELARVTEPFYMVDKSRGRSVGGAGLGLSLCRQIATLHGWQLHLESEEGRGTTASVLW